MKKKLQSKKNIIIVIAAILVIILVLLFVTRTARLEKGLENLGSDFYRSYYKTNEKSKDSKSLKSFLSDFKEIGIKVSLTNLEKYNSKGNKRIIKKLKKLECDKTNTKVTIYPKSPYGINDFEIKVNLSCKK